MLSPIKTNGNKTIPAPNIIQKSNSKNEEDIGISPNIVVIPTIASILNIFDPITLPSATSACLRIAAINVVASSGREVPTATSVNPNVICLSHGGPIATAKEAHYITQRTGCVGFVGASSIERFACEASMPSITRSFKDPNYTVTR